MHINLKNETPIYKYILIDVVMEMKIIILSKWMD